MNVGRALTQLVFLAIMVLSVVFFINGFNTLQERKTFTTKEDRLTEINIDEVSTYQFAFDIDYGLSSVMDISYTATHTQVDFVTLDSVMVLMQNTDTSEYYTLIDPGDTEITINNNMVIGTYELDPGTYNLLITTERGDLSSDQTFILMEKGIGLGIVMVVLSPMAFIGALIGFVVLRIRSKRQREQMIGFHDEPYHMYDGSNAYKQEDPWEMDKDRYDQ